MSLGGFFCKPPGGFYCRPPGGSKMSSSATPSRASLSHISLGGQTAPPSAISTESNSLVYTTKKLSYAPTIQYTVPEYKTHIIMA